MLKHMLNTTTVTNGSVPNRLPSSSLMRPDSSILMDQSHRSYRSAPPPRTPNQHQHQSMLSNHNHQQLQADTSKHSIYSNTILPPGNKSLNGGLTISRVRNQSTVNKFIAKSKQVGVKEMLVSLGLLCLVSLLLALLSLIFLLKISPVTASDIRELLRSEQLTVITAEEYVVVYEVTLALCALTLSLNLCCLLVCAIQFLFAVKLVKSPHGGSDRTNKYLQKSSVSRICAVGGFFISIPIFLTGIILYTFIQFHSTPAIVTSVFIGLGIVFCGCAMVHNVFIWQREKTNAVKELALAQHDQSFAPVANNNQSLHCISPLNQSVHSIATPLSQSLHSKATPLNQSLHSVGPLNQSHISHHFHPASFGIRPATTTPTNDIMLNKTREASGSVSPCMPNVALELSSVATTNSPHELSTLV